MPMLVILSAVIVYYLIIKNIPPFVAGLSGVGGFRNYGDAAVASFYRYWNVLPSAQSIREGRNPAGPPDSVVTLVMAKMGGDWKIVHTHQSNLPGQ